MYRAGRADQRQSLSIIEDPDGPIRWTVARFIEDLAFACLGPTGKTSPHLPPSISIARVLRTTIDATGNAFEFLHSVLAADRTCCPPGTIRAHVTTDRYLRAWAEGREDAGSAQDVSGGQGDSWTRSQPRRCHQSARWGFI
jgi:hypothetical protein